MTEEYDGDFGEGPWQFGAVTGGALGWFLWFAIVGEPQETQLHYIVWTAGLILTIYITYGLGIVVADNVARRI